MGKAHTWTEVDGKPALVFESTPAFIFVSDDGMTSFAYDNGHALVYYGISVKSHAGNPVEYTANCPALKTT
ncbi:hypothetical protein [Paenibacillus tengchongensis]|uniref:hypothetical protein n=1 Tax=Paenibacillus tengchongensis TaxID=2608684 RepID=UPI00124D6341|nr:hypothetical protein [Paenibacillus tengchongensis]